MKNFKIFLFIIFFINYGKCAFANENIAFIDMEFIINNSNLGKSIMKKISDIDNENIIKLKSRDAEIKTLEIEFKEKRNLLSEESLKEEANIIANKINVFKKEKDSMVKKIRETKKNELNNFYKNINPIIENYMNEKNLKLVVDIKSVVIGKSSLNISKEIVDKINIEFK